jgi:septal ring factor EnvC (AmiA/AmiB activator)
LQKRQNLQAELAAVDEALQRVPVEQVLQPLQNELRQHDREQGRLEAELDRLTAEEKRLTYHIERVASSNRRVTEQMAAINTDEGRIKLAARTKLLLDAYQQRLIAKSWRNWPCSWPNG